MQELGHLLKSARTSKGLDLIDVADTLKINKRILIALEEHHPQDLPEATITRGFVRRYAQYLGLDAAQAVAMVGGAQPAQKYTSSSPSSTSFDAPRESGSNAGWVVAGLLLLGAAGAGAWFFLQPKTPAVASKPITETPVVATIKKFTLNLNTYPKGAKVFLDGYNLGTTPLQVPVSEGKRNLQIKLPKYKTYIATVDMSKNRNLSVNMTLGKGIVDADKIARFKAIRQARLAKQLAAKKAAEEKRAAILAARAARLAAAGKNPTTAGQPTEQPTTDKPVATETKPTETSSTNSIVIKTQEASWIRITSPQTRKTLFEGTVPAGKTFTYNQGVVVRAGNAGGVTISVAGKPAKPMGATGAVITQSVNLP